MVEASQNRLLTSRNNVSSVVNWTLDSRLSGEKDNEKKDNDDANVAVEEVALVEATEICKKYYSGIQYYNLFHWT